MSQDTNDMEALFNDMSGASNTTKTSTTAPVQQQAPRKNNQVFAEQNKVMEYSREEYAKQEFGIEIPVDAVPLPSRGLIYPPNSSLHCSEFVEYRGMTTREEDILMSRALRKKGTVIKELVKSCLVDKNINVDSLLSGDQIALMIAIRSTGYGTEYKPSFECPKCQASTQLDVDLSELEIQSLQIEPVEIGQNLFEFTLPVSGKKVLFRFSTVEDEQRIIQEIEAKRKRGLLNDNLVTTKLLTSIVSIDGVSNRSDISKFVAYMPAKDSRALRKYMTDNEPGIKMEVEFQCNACDHFGVIALPVDSEFFWPQS